MPVVSVIIPVYNAENTVNRAVRSVLNTAFHRDIEIIVVDDCSTDDTVKTVEEIQKSFDNVFLYIMPQNSGGPSAPRNLGIEKATGEYIAFLDDDDWYDADRFLNMANEAKRKSADLIKGYLISVNGDKKKIFNRLPGVPATTGDTIRMMISNQSTSNDIIVRRLLLIDNNIRYPTDLKIGEDTVFFSNILVHSVNIQYMDDFFLYYSIGSYDSKNVSSTHRCGDMEINSQITAWERTREILKTISMDYYGLRLHIGFCNTLINIVRYSNGISEETFLRLNKFALETASIIKGKMNLHKRYNDLYNAIISCDYPDYLDKAKRRLLINGYDLKFVLPLVKYLREQYNIKIDEWTGHAAHDEKKSRECAEWADIIWCEWLLGNAVYYAKHKNENQRLIVRAHRFELFRDFGNQIDYNKVDQVIAVGYYYFEKFYEKFKIPRGKMRLLSNYVDENVYTTDKTPDAEFHIGMIGIIPERKGFHRALEILRVIRNEDNRFCLYIMGQSPRDVSWIINNPAEMEYFNKCDRYIEENNLGDAVVYKGFIEREKLYQDVRYVLSLSDDESFHLTPAEGAIAGCMGLFLKWPGVEYIYPQEIIFDTINEIASRIIRASRDNDFFSAQSEKLAAFVKSNYGINHFLLTLDRYLQQLYVQ